MADIITEAAKKLNLSEEEVQELKEGLDAIVEERAKAMADVEVAKAMGKASSMVAEASKKWKDALEEVRKKYKKMYENKYTMRVNRLSQQIEPVLAEAIKVIKAKKHMVEALRHLGKHSTFGSDPVILKENKQLKTELAVVKAKQMIHEAAESLNTKDEKVRFTNAATVLLESSGPTAINKKVLESLMKVVASDRSDDDGVVVKKSTITERVKVSRDNKSDSGSRLSLRIER